MPTAFGAWLSPVERTVRVREVPSSNLGAPTLFNHRLLGAVVSLVTGIRLAARLGAISGYVWQ